MIIYEVVMGSEDYLQKVSYFDEKGSKKFLLVTDLKQLAETYPDIQFTVIPGIKELAFLLHTISQARFEHISIDVDRTIKEFDNKFPNLLYSKTNVTSELNYVMKGLQRLNVCLEDYLVERP